MGTSNAGSEMLEGFLLGIAVGWLVGGIFVWGSILKLERSK